MQSEKLSIYHQRVILKGLSIVDSFAKLGKVPNVVKDLILKAIESSERITSSSPVAPEIKTVVLEPPQPQTTFVGFVSTDGHLSFLSDDLKTGKASVGGRGVYSITNIISGKRYIGQTTDLTRRWAEHIALLDKNTHFNKHLQSSWNKAGHPNFLFQLLEGAVSDQELGVLESKWLEKYKEKSFNQKPTSAYETTPMVGPNGMFGRV